MARGAKRPPKSSFFFPHENEPLVAQHRVYRKIIWDMVVSVHENNRYLDPDLPGGTFWDVPRYLPSPRVRRHHACYSRRHALRHQ